MHFRRQIAIFLGAVFISGATARADSLQLRIEGGLLFREPHAQSPGINLSAARPVQTAGDLTLSVGLSAGGFLHPSPSYSTFLLMPEAFISVAYTNFFWPRVGVATGVALNSGPYSGTEYALFLKAGADFQISDGLFLTALPTVGIVGTDVVYLPLLGMSIR